MGALRLALVYTTLRRGRVTAAWMTCLGRQLLTECTMPCLLALREMSTCRVSIDKRWRLRRDGVCAGSRWKSYLRSARSFLTFHQAERRMEWASTPCGLQAASNKAVQPARPRVKYRRSLQGRDPSDIAPKRLPDGIAKQLSRDASAEIHGYADHVAIARSEAVLQRQLDAYNARDIDAARCTGTGCPQTRRATRNRLTTGSVLLARMAIPLSAPCSTINGRTGKPTAFLRKSLRVPVTTRNGHTERTVRKHVSSGRRRH
jgi:hypothetical protein